MATPLPPELLLATSRYQARDLILASGLAPVRTTVGRPRFRLGYELAGFASELAPYGAFGVDDPVEFERRYVDRLERAGVASIGATLQAIAHRAGSPGCVLLCFEDVLAGESCHRRVFAAWWEAKTGQPVLELGS